jgi:hypothetical protein
MEVVPIYSMMTAMIPISILQVVQRLQRDFIWGDTLLMGENTMLFNGS